MNRGDVYNARLNPVEGSEQGGNRPVIIVSRNALNASSSFVIAVPCTTYRPQKELYPSQILIIASDGGLNRDSIALGEQIRVLSKTRLLRLLGTLSEETISQLDRALLMTLDLPGQETDEDS